MYLFIYTCVSEFKLSPDLALPRVAGADVPQRSPSHRSNSPDPGASGDLFVVRHYEGTKHEPLQRPGIVNEGYDGKTTLTLDWVT